MNDKEEKIYFDRGPIPEITPLSLSYGVYVALDDYTKLYDEWCRLRDEYDKVLEENTKLKQWDANKDTRNSRQRIANKNLVHQNKKLSEELDELYTLLNMLDKRPLIRKFDKEFSREYNKYINTNGVKGKVYITPDAEEIYKRYYYYRDNVQAIVELIDRDKVEIQIVRYMLYDLYNKEFERNR